jgi:hypothetical protein
MEWVHQPKTGRYQAHLDGRTFDLEPDGVRKKRWILWYGRPGRRLMIGTAHSLTEGKLAAEDLAVSITRIRERTED